MHHNKSDFQFIDDSIYAEMKLGEEKRKETKRRKNTKLTARGLGLFQPLVCTDGVNYNKTECSEMAETTKAMVQAGRKAYTDIYIYGLLRASSSKERDFRSSRSSQ